MICLLAPAAAARFQIVFALPPSAADAVVWVLGFVRASRAG
jgi:hypothetical protein